MNNDKRYSWTQPACEICYAEHFPNTNPSRMVDAKRDSEICVWCGYATMSGLYVRIDPATVPHPSLLKR